MCRGEEAQSPSLLLTGTEPQLEEQKPQKISSVPEDPGYQGDTLHSCPTRSEVLENILDPGCRDKRSILFILSIHLIFYVCW